MLNALTVDVEDYFHVEAFAGVIAPEEWSRYPMRVEINTRRILEMFSRRCIRATFFVLGWVADRCPALIRDISAAGHEVGCHGYNHQMIGRSDQSEFRNDILRAKAVLEELSGAAVKSYRAPSYSVTANTLWALEILHEVGFEYDSSIFPVVHDHYGIPNAPRFPHYRSLRDGRRIIEFPPSTLSAYGAHFPVAGGGYFRLFPYKLSSWAIRQLNEKEAQPAMFYLHPWEIDPEQPRVNASWLSRFRHYQNLGSTEAKFLRLLDDFAWAPMSEVVSATLRNDSYLVEVTNGA